MESFKNIDFGKADAKTEGVENPDLLRRGYLDAMGITKAAWDSSKYLFLGYKGAGKSALSEHMSLSAKNDPTVFVREILLSKFPYKLFNKIIKGDAEASAKHPLAWEWLLLLYVFESFQNDEMCRWESIDEWETTLKTLRKAGLLPIKTITDIVQKTSKNSFKISLPSLEAAHEETATQTDITIDLIIDYMKNLLLQVKTSCRHYLIIDGLDEFLSSKEYQLTSIVALINVAKDLNIWFKKFDIPFKIIVLCRTDVFDQTSDSNKNKLRRDYSFPIRWFNESETDDYSKSNLIQLANLRGSLVYPEIKDIFKKFFPEQFNGASIYQVLLDHTRHTPRDFLQLLTFIQDTSSGQKVSRKDIETGIKNYSLEYFQNEIRDEMAGKLEASHIQAFFNLLSQVREREFMLKDIEAIAKKSDKYEMLDLEQIFNILFECSAIGHKRGDTEGKYYFKFRNPAMVFDSTAQIALHKGLWKAFVS